MEEEGEKRKPDDNDVVSKSTTKKPKEETEEVGEEEVEEFFAILRRIQVAVKYFTKVDGASGSSYDGRRKKTKDIDRKCSDEIIGDNEEMKEKEKEKEKNVEEKNKLGFDLNMEPYDPYDENTSS